VSEIPRDEIDAARARQARTRLARLTRREREILDLAARHLTSKQIGPRLGIQPASVDTFVQTIIRKLEVPGRKDAVRIYLDALDVDALSRDGRGRDDLDFGTSTMAGPGATPLADRVFDTGDASGSESDDAADGSLAGQRGDQGSGRLVRRRGGGDFRRPWPIAGPPEPDRRPGAGDRAPPVGAPPAWTFNGARRLDRVDRGDRRPGDPIGLLSSAGRRLLLMAIITLFLGLVMAGATAAGYDLTQVIDRLFLEHVYNAQGAKTPGTTP
jgi:DNA-binding CsgD family transcriptional regulator